MDPAKITYEMVAKKARISIRCCSGRRVTALCC